LKLEVHEGDRTDDLFPGDLMVENFKIPAQTDDLVPRPRLQEHLELGVAGPLTLVSAPAGTGKTVSVAAWASSRQAPGPITWVTLEARDGSQTRFRSSFTQGLKSCGVVIPPRPSALSDQVDDGFVDPLASALSKRTEPVFVVLDFASDISAEVAEDLDALLRRSGRWLRLVVVTRTDRALPLHRYRLGGTVVELRKEDLAFRLDEARELMTRTGMELSETALRAIVERTQGWAAGLRFAALSMHQRKDTDLERTAREFRGDTGDVAEYLMGEVLDMQPADSRQLLLQTSIVDVLQPGLSESVAGPDAHRALSFLARGNAFLDELPASPGFYRYQPLFRELLRAQLTYESPAKVPELHRTAAAWMADQGLVEEAVRHAAEAGDWLGAARYLIDGLAIGRLLLPGGDALADVLARLPSDTGGLSASLVRAALALAVFDVERCEEHLVRAERELDSAGTPNGSAAALSLQMVRMTHAASVANVEAALRAAAAAEGLLQQQAPERLDEHPELPILVESSRGAAWLAKGRLDEAMEAFSAGARAADRPGSEGSLIHCLGHLAMLAAMRGQLRRASDLSGRAADIQNAPRLAETACPSASVAKAWVSTELYDLPAARRHAQRAAESLAEAHDPTTRVALALVDSRIKRARGDVDGALARIVTARSETPAPPWLQDALAIEEAELHVVNGQPALAAQVVEGLYEPGSPESALVLARARMSAAGTVELPTTTLRSTAASIPTRIDGWLLEATRLLDHGEQLRAAEALERALRLAAPERLRRPFREASPQVRRLLRWDRNLATEHSWLGAATLDDDRPPKPRRGAEPDISLNQPGQRPIPEALTEKELEVLGHLAAWLTTEEIAGAMFVSVNTVRTHVRHILRKLGSSRRYEAVRHAGELGIIQGWTTAETGSERPQSAGSRSDR
jgi:LuxR family transcriptional regulator, maltose regulon positive regulatory protein